jgi:uncharacterized protein YoxC
MGLINSTLNAVTLGTLGTRSTNVSASYAPDFPEGFIIEEFIDGAVKSENTIVMAGSWMPFQPFKFGGTQQINKQYYAGNKEPTVQILGSREDSITINGRLKLKTLNDPSLKNDFTNAVYERQKELDAMRIRGNLVKIKLRDWYRYAFIENVEFNLKRTIDIDYSITFSIVGLTAPTNSMFLENTDDNPFAPNRQLTSRASELFQEMNNIPSEMPQTIADQLNNLISAVSEAVALVTGFVDGIVEDAESIVASANRALGLIRYARAKVSETTRRIGRIETSTASLGSSFSSEADKLSATIKNTDHLHKIQDGNLILAALLADLQNRFKSIATTLPYRRHLVRDSDTLQTISIKYYNTADNWDRIYDANKLTSTELEIGTILEIPRI